MDYGSITAAVTSLRAISDIARGLRSLKTLSDVQSVSVDLTERIIDAQQQLLDANAALLGQVERIRELEAELARMNDWETQKQRYKLATPFPACMVYALQKSMAEGQPPHYVCASCYQRGHLSILQGKEGRAGVGYAMYHCPDRSCHAEATTPWRNVTPPQYFEDIAPSR